MPVQALKFRLHPVRRGLTRVCSGPGTENLPAHSSSWTNAGVLLVGPQRNLLHSSSTTNVWTLGVSGPSMHWDSSAHSSSWTNACGENRWPFQTHSSYTIRRGRTRVLGASGCQRKFLYTPLRRGRTCVLESVVPQAPKFPCTSLVEDECDVSRRAPHSTPFI